MLTVETEREEETGRWLADIPALPGVMAYGRTEVEARSAAMALAFRVMAERIEHNEPLPPEALTLFAA